MGRRTLTMVANGHVELLEIPTVDFYGILKRYPRLKAHFLQFINIHTDYLVGGEPIPESNEFKKSNHVSEVSEQKGYFDK